MALSTAESQHNGQISDGDGRQVVVVAGQYETQSNFGSTAAAPAAGAVIISILAANLPAGRYKVKGCVFQSGSPDANLLNGAIKKAGTTLANLPSTSQPGAYTECDVVVLDGATNLNLTVGPTAGGAGAVYNGVIMATRLL